MTNILEAMYNNFHRAYAWVSQSLSRAALSIARFFGFDNDPISSLNSRISDLPPARQASVANAVTAVQSHFRGQSVRQERETVTIRASLKAAVASIPAAAREMQSRLSESSGIATVEAQRKAICQDTVVKGFWHKKGHGRTMAEVVANRATSPGS